MQKRVVGHRKESPFLEKHREKFGVFSQIVVLLQRIVP